MTISRNLSLLADGVDSSGVLSTAAGGTGLTSLATGVVTFLGTPTSANLKAVITDETGSGLLVFGTSPTLTTPVVSTSITTASTTFALLNTNATTVTFANAATSLSIGASTGTTTVNNDLVITGNITVNGTTTTINSTTYNVDDKNIELGAVATPTDTTADGGGIDLLGTTTKYLRFDNANQNWTSSENWNIPTGKVFKINNTAVLSATTLGSGVTASSLTSVGTIATGVWNGTSIAVANGGTGATTVAAAQTNLQVDPGGTAIAMAIALG
jgi:hypothetical protein